MDLYKDVYKNHTTFMYCYTNLANKIIKKNIHLIETL